MRRDRARAERTAPAQGLWKDARPVDPASGDRLPGSGTLLVSLPGGRRHNCRLFPGATPPRPAQQAFDRSGCQATGSRFGPSFGLLPPLTGLSDLQILSLTPLRTSPATSASCEPRGGETKTFFLRYWVSVMQSGTFGEGYAFLTPSASRVPPSLPHTPPLTLASFP